MESGLIREFGLNGQMYSFQLCRSPSVRLGATEIDQWWMPVTPLYGQRKKKGSLAAHNHSEILRLYWNVVRHEGAEREQEAQERLLLASLVPYVRAEGSRTIFADAFLGLASRKHRDSQFADLDTLLDSGRTKSMNREEFHQQSWNLLGRPSFPEGLREIYDSYVAQLFDEPCDGLGRGNVDDALNSTRRNWDRLMKGVARRAGHAVEKTALDVLSYESRAAFHQCYSVAWCALIPSLSLDEKFSQPTSFFHRFWHTDWVDSQTSASLFHGHVFGLHPAMGFFMMTATGRELLGNWLLDPYSAEALGHLLNGCHAAVYHYGLRRELAVEDRRNRRREAALDPEAADEMQVERRQGRRRRGS